MNNTINSVSNISFNSRYFNVDSLENVPPRISRAILQNEAIDEFISAGKPKTVWSMILDLFKKDEILDVFYNVTKKSQESDFALKASQKNDPFAQDEVLSFVLRKGADDTRFHTMKASQEGVKRQAGSVPKPGEHYLYKAPNITATEQLARNIEEIKNLDILLK